MCIAPSSDHSFILIRLMKINSNPPIMHYDFNPFSTERLFSGWTLYKVYGGFRISYGMG